MATLQGWGGIRGGRVRQRPPKCAALSHVGGTEEPAGDPEHTDIQWFSVGNVLESEALNPMGR